MTDTYPACQSIAGEVDDLQGQLDDLGQQLFEGRGDKGAIERRMKVLQGQLNLKEVELKDCELNSRPPLLSTGNIPVDTIKQPDGSYVFTIVIANSGGRAYHVQASGILRLYTQPPPSTNVFGGSLIGSSEISGKGQETYQTPEFGQGLASGTLLAGTITVTYQDGIGTQESYSVDVWPIVGHKGEFSFTPTSGFTPQSLQKGTEVVFFGNGFQQESKVSFPNDTIATSNDKPCSPALAKPTSVSVDGSELHVNVPRLATTGPLTVIAPDGIKFVFPSSFTVHSYRNTNGFSFGNYSFESASFDDLVELFGDDQTHLTILGKSLGIPDPLAVFFNWIVDQVLIGHESCFGISLTSQRLLHGDKPFSAFNPPGATSVWQLDGPDGPSNDLAHYIHVLHIAQLSSEFLHFYLGRGIGNIWASGSDIRNQVSTALSSGDHPLIAIRKSLTDGFHGHVIVAYDLEDGENSPVDFYINVYNSNIPFLASSENAEGCLHLIREQQDSRLHLVNNSWDFPQLDWGGDLNSLIVVPYGIVPIQPTIPTSLSGITTLIFGDGSQTTQIADAQGHTLFLPDGTLNTDPTTRLQQAIPFAPLDSNGPAKDLYLLDGDGPYTHTVRALDDGGYRYTHLSPGLVTHIMTAATNPGLSDEILLNQQTSQIQFRSGGTQGLLKAHLLARVDGGDVHTVIVTTTSIQGASMSLAFDQSRQTLTYKHTGATTDYSVVFEGTNKQGQRVAFASSSLSINPDEIASFTPLDWRQLDGTTVTLTVTQKDGTQRVETLSTPSPVTTDAPMFGYDLQHTHFNPYETILTPANVSRLVPYWTATVATDIPSGVDLISSPAVVNGIVYVGSNDHKLYAINASSGQILWTAATQGEIPSSPAVVNGIVYIGSFTGSLYAFDAATGAQRWRAAAAGTIFSSPSVANGVVYSASYQGNLSAFDAATGTPLWIRAVSADLINSSPAVVNGVVYIGSDDGKLATFDATTGTPLWTFPTGDRIRSSPAVVNGVVYIGSDDGKLYAVNATTGKQVWVFSAGSRIRSSPAVANGVVYIGSNVGKVYALNASSGQVVWGTSAGIGSPTGSDIDSSPMVANGVIYIGFYSDLYAFDASTGQTLWSVHTPNQVESSPTIINGVVYVGSRDGKLYAFHLPG